MMLSQSVKFSMRRMKRFRISSVITDISPVCLTSKRQSGVHLTRDGMTANRLHRMHIKKCCFTTQRKIGDIGFVSNIIENHDEPRGVSRYIPEGDCCDASKKMLGGLNFMLRGLPFIYQGQELGMENVKFESIDQVDDISSLDEYKVALNAGCTPEEALKAVSRFSRDNARTPMQWT